MKNTTTNYRSDYFIQVLSGKISTYYQHGGNTMKMNIKKHASVEKAQSYIDTIFSKIS